MSILINQNTQITSLERRTCEFMVNAYGLRGDAFHTVTFRRESVFLTADGTEVKRVQDVDAFEFTPQTIAQAPDLAAAIATIYRYLDGADSTYLPPTN